MNTAEEKLARMALKTSVRKDELGDLTFKFTLFCLIPREALGYLHYITKVFTVLPAVRSCDLNERTGEVRVIYDADRADSGMLMRWLRTAADTCLAALKDDPAIERMPEEAVVALVREKLTAAARDFFR